jgi:hypothetical protein
MAGEQWDAPNQQVVRPDQSAPWEEGNGGSQSLTAEQWSEQPASLDEMTKAQLLEHAQQLGISPANAAMSKEELRAAIDEHEAVV